MKYFFTKIINVAGRECRLMISNPIYIFCMVLLPLLVVFFFTSMLGSGQPTELPVGVVDHDNTPTSRKVVRTLDSFQTSHVVAHYSNVTEARRAMQQGRIYAYLLIPKGTTSNLMAQKQPKVSFYYNGVVMLAGSTTFKDMKTALTLASASVGMTKLSAIGKTEHEIKTFLQPITIDLHMISNPWADYNVYLTNTMVPGLIMLFIFLITPYSIGTELKFGRGRNLMLTAGNNPLCAIIGKMLPQTLIFLTIFYGFEFYVFHTLDFPHPGGVLPIILLGLLAVLSAQGFGILIFFLLPTLRMSMSVCSLWAMLSFSLCGATFPVSAMDPPLQALAWLFPLRSYYMIYQINILNGFALSYSLVYWLVMLAFALLPVFILRRIKRVMLLFRYIP